MYEYDVARMSRIIRNQSVRDCFVWQKFPFTIMVIDWRQKSQLSPPNVVSRSRAVLWLPACAAVSTHALPRKKTDVNQTSQQQRHTITQCRLEKREYDLIVKSRKSGRRDRNTTTSKHLDTKSARTTNYKTIRGVIKSFQSFHQEIVMWGTIRRFSDFVLMFHQVQTID